MAQSGVYGSVGQSKAIATTVSDISRVRIQAVLVFSRVFIMNLINDKSKHNTNKNVTICIVLSWAPHSYL